jgi:hypothetical protein
MCQRCSSKRGVAAVSGRKVGLPAVRVMLSKSNVSCTVRRIVTQGGQQPMLAFISSAKLPQKQTQFAA